MRSPDVLVMGVGRSGTSTVARILHDRFLICMGHDFIDTGEANPKGTYESKIGLGATYGLLEKKNIAGWLRSYETIHSRCDSRLRGVKVPHLAGITPGMLNDISPKLVVIAARDSGLNVASMARWRSKGVDWSEFFDKRTESIRRLVLGGNCFFMVVKFGAEYRSDADVANDLAGVTDLFPPETRPDHSDFSHAWEYTDTGEGEGIEARKRHNA